MPQQRSTDHLELKPAQQRVLGVLKSEGTSRLTRARYEELSGVSRSQAAYDLAELVEHGILERLGSGRATRYRIVHQTTPGRNGRRRWTQERIRASLEEFCAGRDGWPSATEFKQAGRFDLYVAASRYGGIKFWTSELGLTREQPPAAPAARPPRRWAFRPRLQWVPAAGVAVLALALAGAGHIRLSPGGAVLESAPPRVLDTPTLMRPPAARERAHRVAKPVHRVVRHTKPAAHVARTKPAQHASTSTGSTELASVQSSASSSGSSSSAPEQTTPPAHTTSSTPTPATSSNPAPLPAPSGGNGARPLPPPRR